MTQESILSKINALLAKTVENGASEAEANTAIEMAQRLMEKHMIDESQLADHALDKKCQQITVDMYPTGYDLTALNGVIADAFDCRCWWNRHKEEVYFFGFGDDAKLAAYFYRYLNEAMTNEARKYRLSLEFVEQKIKGYHGKTIIASFRKGMMIRLIQRLADMKAKRQSNILRTTGTDLVLVKDDQVSEEYDALGIKAKSKKQNWDVTNVEAYGAGVERADNVNMVGGIEHDEAAGQIGKKS